MSATLSIWLALYGFLLQNVTAGNGIGLNSNCKTYEKYLSTETNLACEKSGPIRQ